MHDRASTELPWWRGLSRYHWSVFTLATFTWFFDCLDQQLFVLARITAMQHLLPPGTDPGPYGTWATAAFMFGWAVGGMVFGAMGDRIGRARTLTITVLLYSVFTGLSAFAQSWIDFTVMRVLTGLGVGGVFGLAVALVADSLPDRSRAGALGTLQSSSTLGNLCACLISLAIGGFVASGVLPAERSWQAMFLIGALPAFLCVLLRRRLQEPEKWVKARAAGRATGVAFGSYRDLFFVPRWRRAALAGMALSMAGVIGLWGIGFFSPELVGPVVEAALRAEGMAEAKIVGARTQWISLNMIVQNASGFVGMLAMTWLCQRIGRRPAMAITFVLCIGSTIAFFQCFQGPQHLWLTAAMGFCQFAVFAGFAIYLPELFPTRLRSTGTSFCYNVGRFFAALGILQSGAIKTWVAAGAATAAEKLDAFRDALSGMTVVFAVGLVALLFLPETKGQPLPEDVAV